MLEYKKFCNKIKEKFDQTYANYSDQLQWFD